MEWPFGTEVNEDRQSRLRSARDFVAITEQISDEMQIKSFDVCPAHGKIEGVSGCRRPFFSIEVSEHTFDLFFNSCNGYRAQYYESIERGERANAHLISRLSERLVQYAIDKGTKNIMSEEELELSLGMPSSKIWMNEKGVRKQRTDLKLVDGLLVERWRKAAKDYIAAHDPYHDPNKIIEEKALDGVRAPTGTMLEIKGAWISEDGKEQIHDSKKDRSEQIYLYGFS